VTDFPALDINVTNIDSTTPSQLALLVPPDVRVEALFNARSPDSRQLHIMPGDGTASAPALDTYPGYQVAGASLVELRILTDTSQQISVLASSTNSEMHAVTSGWVDIRGKNG